MHVHDPLQNPLPQYLQYKAIPFSGNVATLLLPAPSTEYVYRASMGQQDSFPNKPPVLIFDHYVQ